MQEPSSPENKVSNPQQPAPEPEDLFGVNYPYHRRGNNKKGSKHW